MAEKGGCMRYVSPLDGVFVKESDSVPAVDSPVRTGNGWQANNSECAFQAEGVGEFHVYNGDKITYAPVPGADREWVMLWLNSQVLVALLHQRKIINFHASSFIYQGLGVMVLGETGAGKSSLTLAFAQRNGGFLTDDITPVIFKGPVPCIMPLHRKVKIRKDTAEKLGISSSILTDAEKGTNKQYLSLEPVQKEPHPLNLIISISAGHNNITGFIFPPSADRFSLLRSEICSWEILAGMPETEKAYMEQLVKIVGQTGFIKAVRSPGTDLNSFYDSVREEILKFNL
jgi:hypothetical protein